MADGNITVEVITQAAQAELERLRAALATLRAALSEAPGEEREAAWFSLVMNAAAELEDAANCLRDTDAERKARNGSKYYRDRANSIWRERGA